VSDLAAAVRPYLAAALAGDRDAQDKVWRAIEPFVTRVVRRRLLGAREQDVEDFVQELAIKLVVGPEPQCRHWNSTRPLAPWLGQVVANACIDEMRRRAADVSAKLVSLDADGAPTPPARQVSPEAVAMGHELARILDDMTADLPEAQAAVLESLRSGATRNEAAHEASCDVRTVSRAKASISERLQHSGYEVPGEDTSASAAGS